MSLQTTSRPTDQQLIDVFEFLKDFFLIFDKDLRVIWVNKAFENLTGISQESWFGETLWNVFPETGAPDSPHRLNFQKVIETKKQHNYTYRSKYDMWVEVSVNPTKEGGIAVVGHDISPRMRANQAAEQQQRLYIALADSTPDLVAVYDLDYRQIYTNKVVLKLWGKTKEEAAGKTLEEVGIDKKLVDEFRPNFHKTISTKKPTRGSYSILRPNIGMRDYDYINTPVIDDQGNVTEVISYTRDITDIKNAEDARLHQFETQQRMELLTEQRNALIKLNEAKDEFVSLASHQLRTPATAVKQYVGMILDGMAGSLTHKQTSMLQATYDSNERQLLMINALLKTAQIDAISQQNLDTTPCDVIEIVKSSISDFQDTLKQHKQRVHFNERRRSIILPILEIEMKLAFINLIENASKYSRAGSAIKVSVKSTKNHVLISVADQGVGIAPENHGKVFEKFTRVSNELSDSVSGSGLGLYWVKRITEMHGGYITLASARGEGTTFTIKLPKSAA